MKENKKAVALNDEQLDKVVGGATYGDKEVFEGEREWAQKPSIPGPGTGAISAVKPGDNAGPVQDVVSAVIPGEGLPVTPDVILAVKPGGGVNEF